MVIMEGREKGVLRACTILPLWGKMVYQIGEKIFFIDYAILFTSIALQTDLCNSQTFQEPNG